MGGGCGFPPCLEGGQTPGNRTRSKTPPLQAPAFLSPSLRGEPSVCNGFSSPETVVLLQPDASEPSAWRQLLSCPSTCAPTRPAAPRSSPLSSPAAAAAAAATPSTHPDPASQLRRERKEREERRAKYLRKRGVPIRTALPSGGGQADRGGERKQGTEKERGQPAQVGAARSERSLL